jgi:hypothetical protein
MENCMTAASETSNPPEQHSLLDKLKRALLTPIRAMRLRYLPLLMIYYAYGALGLVAIAEAFWIKEALTLSPVELAAIGVWLTLPWTIKMVFGQLADSVPILGSQRRAYVFIGACLVAAGMVILAGAAGGWITFASKNALYVTAQLLIVIGVVLQDVIADAMTTEVVERTLPDGTPKPEAEIQRELGLVQVLGRLALWSGILSVAGLSSIGASSAAVSCSAQRSWPSDLAAYRSARRSCFSSRSPSSHRCSIASPRTSTRCTASASSIQPW